MGTRILQDSERPHTVRCQKQHVGYLQLLGMENDGAGVFTHIQQDANDPGEVKGGQVGVDGQIIVDGEDGFRESHLIPGEPLTIAGDRRVLVLAFIW